MTYRLRPVPQAVELTDLPAVRPEERRRQIRLTLRNDRLQNLPWSERDQIRMRLAAGQIALDCLTGFERIASLLGDYD
jgi:hypothetical protein